MSSAAKACPGEGRGLDRHADDPAQELALAKAGGGQFVLHAKALHGNPFDGHTLGSVITHPCMEAVALRR